MGKSAWVLVGDPCHCLGCLVYCCIARDRSICGFLSRIKVIISEFDMPSVVTTLAIAVALLLLRKRRNITPQGAIEPLPER